MDSDEFLQGLLRLDIEDTLRTAINKNLDKAADMNRDQLMKGFDSKGKRLRRYKNKSYATFKAAMNPVPGFGNPDLYLTGAFQKAIKASLADDDILLNSSNSKTEELVEKYSEDILDLSDDSSSNFADEITPDFEKAITAVSGLEFE